MDYLNMDKNDPCYNADAARDMKIEALEKQAELFKEYIKFLNEANEGPITLASVHGWKCPQEDIDKGKEFRKRLNIEPFSKVDNALINEFNQYATKQLRKIGLEVEKQIEENDGRLTVSSSADLDFALDKRDVIRYILNERKKGELNENK